MSKLQEEIQAVQDLLAQIGRDDPELLEDMIEGQTEFKEIMGWLVNKIKEEDAFADAIAARIKHLQDRKKAAERRIENLKRLIVTSLKQLSLRQLKLPDGTLSISSLAPSPILNSGISPSTLPPEYQRIKVEADMVKIRAAIKEGKKIDGVIMDNGGEALVIRV